LRERRTTPPDYLQTFLRGEIDKWAAATEAADVTVE